MCVCREPIVAAAGMYEISKSTTTTTTPFLHSVPHQYPRETLNLPVCNVGASRAPTVHGVKKNPLSLTALHPFSVRRSSSSRMVDEDPSGDLPEYPDLFKIALDGKKFASISLSSIHMPPGVWRTRCAYGSLITLHPNDLRHHRSTLFSACRRHPSVVSETASIAHSICIVIA